MKFVDGKFVITGFPVYNPRHGAFAIPRVKRWLSCREQFHTQLLRPRKDKSFLFTVGDQFSGKTRVVKFIRVIENRLCLAERTVFTDTNMDHALLVSPSKWWFEQPMRINLFTVLLRCGLNYSGNVDNAILSYEYGRQTIRAIKWFLGGNTHYNGNKSNQWHDTFINMNIDLIKFYLTDRPFNASRQSRIEAQEIIRASGHKERLRMIAAALDRASVGGPRT